LAWLEDYAAPSPSDKLAVVIPCYAVHAYLEIPVVLYDKLRHGGVQIIACYPNISREPVCRAFPLLNLPAATGKTSSQIHGNSGHYDYHCENDYVFRPSLTSGWH